MASDKVTGDGKGEPTLSVIRKKLRTGELTSLTPEEAELVLNWAAECDDKIGQAELLRIFECSGGKQALEQIAKRLH